MGRLRCRSVNHSRIRHNTFAIITRCVRCGKPTCSDCEGTDNGFRDICDRCWWRLDKRITRARYRGYYRTARAIVKKWAARGRPPRPLWGLRRFTSYYRQVLADYDLDTPETGYQSRS